MFDPIRSLRALFRRLPDQRIPPAIVKWAGDRKQTPGPKKKLILLQAMDQSHFLGLFTVVSRLLEEREPVGFELFVSRSVEAGFGNGLRSRLLRTFPHVYLRSQQWARTYAPITERVGYRSVSWDRPLSDCLACLRADATWRKLHSADELAELRYRDIQYGDLVIDTYLRFAPARTVALRDPFLRSLVWQAFRDIDRATDYFRRRKPDLYIGSYSTYIQHGIAVRSALQAGVKVVTFSNFQEIGKRHAPNDPFQTRANGSYRTDFLSLPNREKLIEDAKENLEKRLSGGTDVITGYMRRSAYGSNVDLPDVAGSVVIFLHDFYDSPHIYPGLLFPDFWQWANATIRTLSAAGRRVFLKPHPNQVGPSELVVQELLAINPGAKVLPSAVSNAQLARGGIACGVTMFGTVAHELAYLGVPVIAAAGNPHSGYDFCRTARSREEYEGLLGRASELAYDDPEAVRREVLEFYVMHNLSLPPEQLVTRDKIVGLWKACLDDDVDINEVLSRLDGLRNDAGLKHFVDQLLS